MQDQRPQQPEATTRIALIAIDLDGTLLRSDSSISDRTRRALETARAAGVIVMSVTARPPRRVRQIAETTGLSGLAICSNGGVLYHIEHNVAIQQRVLPEEIAVQLVLDLRAELPEIRFAVEAGMRYGCEPGYTIVHPLDLHDAAMVRQDALALCGMGVTKLIVQHPARRLDELLAIAARLAGTRASVTHSGSNFVEVAAAGVTKVLALEDYCDEHGIERHTVVAFGDMPNDLPMLEWAGYGVAVANAHPEVRAAANEITASNDEDGVATVLDRLAGDGFRLETCAG